MGRSMSNINYKQHAEELAKVVENFLWAHTGGDDGRCLPDLYADAMDALENYRKVSTGPDLRLKNLISLAYAIALENGKDPWAEVLKTIGRNAKRWEEFAEDDTSIYEDICAWLEYESSLEIEAVQ
jgi:hypothetical protein